MNYIITSLKEFYDLYGFKTLKGIYLYACKARHNDFNIIYNDIDKKFGCDLICDALSIDLSLYDYVIATPPCNWWSKANPYYKTSLYALSTKHHLPDCIKNLGSLGKPFIIENVINKKRFKENGIFDLIDYYHLYYVYIGRHIYISNCSFLLDIDVPQHQDFSYCGVRVNDDGYNQGGSNVWIVINSWLNLLFKYYFKGDLKI